MKQILKKADIEKAKRSKKSLSNQLFKLGAIVLERSGHLHDRLCNNPNRRKVTPNPTYNWELKGDATVAAITESCKFCATGAIIRSAIEYGLTKDDIDNFICNNQTKFISLMVFNDFATKDDTIKEMRRVA